MKNLRPIKEHANFRVGRKEGGDIDIDRHLLNSILIGYGFLVVDVVYS